MSPCPHTRGDDPGGKLVTDTDSTLVPTRVGMIPLKNILKHCACSCPHTRGDDPRFFLFRFGKYFLSPHAWG